MELWTHTYIRPCMYKNKVIIYLTMFYQMCDLLPLIICKREISRIQAAVNFTCYFVYKIF